MSHQHYYLKSPPLALKHFCFLLGLLAPLGLFSQSISQSVIGNAGSYYEQASVGNLHWTLGEISVEQYEDEQILSQGFHQTYSDLIITSIGNETIKNWSINVFPNPSPGLLRIETDQNKDLQLRLSNLLGQHLLSKSFNLQTEINLTSLPVGTYWLTIFQSGQILKTFKIQKT